jgi:predicted nucleic acid-binding protein
MTPALVADSGGLLRALESDGRGGPAWPEYARELASAAVIIVPALVLAEVDYFLGRRRSAMRALLGDIFDPRSRYEFEPATPSDFARAMEFDSKFADLDLGLVDGLVAAVAERRRVHRVLTTDRAEFAAVRVGDRYNRPLTLLPR